MHSRRGTADQTVHYGTLDVRFSSWDQFDPSKIGDPKYLKSFGVEADLERIRFYRDLGDLVHPV